MLIDAVRRFLASSGIGPSHVLVAASAGVDSTALLLAFADLRLLGFTVTCGHVNHHLRGEESDGDETFLVALCARLEIPLLRVDAPLEADRVRASGVEAAARTVRETALQRMREECGARWIATAHQMNDQAETVLMRLATGSGIRGLRAIHPVRDDGFIRPLLDVTRDEIERFLATLGITARHDSSNDDPRFLRNRVRRALGDLGIDAVRSISGVARDASVLWPALEARVDAAESECVIETGETETRFARFPDDPWVARALLMRHVGRLASTREITSESLSRVVEWSRERRRITVSKELELVRTGDALVLRLRAVRTAAEPLDTYEIAGEGSVRLPDGSRIVVRKLGAIPASLSDESHSRQVFALPPEATAEFAVRSRRPGDRFAPLGMRGTRKVKDVLIDRKIPVEIRDHVPILTCGGAIVWIASVGVSEHFKVSDVASNVYEVICERDESTGHN
jgi:tRNA(Ile)-lysidine synthase